jgi:hypothetical protein
MKSKRHPRLLKMTGDMDNDQFADWLRLSAAEQFPDSEKVYFTPEDVAEFEHESSVNGREFNRLSELKKRFEAVIKKGTEEKIVFEIPATVGTKKLELQRRQNDDLIEKGYDLIEMDVFGIVNTDAETMEYFNIEGEMIENRNRELTPKEKHKFIGMFARSLRVNNEIIDENTGEVLRRASGE